MSGSGEKDERSEKEVIAFREGITFKRIANLRKVGTPEIFVCLYKSAYSLIKLTQSMPKGTVRYLLWGVIKILVG